VPLTHYVTLGRSGLRVSPHCLGTMTFGDDWGWGCRADDARDILARYLDAGGNFIDTANIYTNGHAEQIIGDYFAETPHRRQQAVIATKFFGSLFTGDPNAGGAGRKSIHAALDHSLRRLRTDYVDLYWMHCWDPFTPIDETMRALDDLVRAGKVRYVGVSDTPAWKVTQAQMLAHWKGWTPLVALQIEYSLLQRTVEGELVPMARELGLGVTPWSPLKAGVLSGKYTRATRGTDAPARGARVTHALTDATYDLIDVLVRVAGELGTTPARVALAWVQQQPGVASTIIGARTLQQLDDNLGALDVVLGPAHRAALDEVSKPVLNFPSDFVRGAGSIAYGGTTIAGRTFAPWPLAPADDAQRY
jgi:aryl-alcohol dehydrogenase-like predicted oxidoreductase